MMVESLQDEQTRRSTVLGDRSAPVASAPRSLARRIHVARIRAVASVATAAQRTTAGHWLLERLARWRLARGLTAMLVGYRRVFPTLVEATRQAERFAGQGHSSPAYLSLHDLLAEEARPSDYPVLFHLERIARGPTSVFDLGGCVGNLHACYRRYLARPDDLDWTVCDLPATVAAGRARAAANGARGLRFTESLEDASGSRVLLVSGALHYLEFDLADFLALLAVRPRHVLINRSPLTDVPTVATVQDANGFILPCRLIDRRELIDRLRNLGYRLIDRWECPELALMIPFDPRHSVRAYSGLYFRAT